MEQKNHKHLVLNATVTNPLADETACKQWLEKLVELIDMKILIPPVAKYCETCGNEGVTGTVVIETSHASIHVWSKEEVPYIKMDVYSCKDFDPDAVVQYVRDTMGEIKGAYVVLDRNGICPDIIKALTFNQ
jgi:S-adenosylmethionine/arginine decarboxylase-like enzyme